MKTFKKVKLFYKKTPFNIFEHYLFIYTNFLNFLFIFNGYIPDAILLFFSLHSMPVCLYFCLSKDYPNCSDMSLEVWLKQTKTYFFIGFFSCVVFLFAIPSWIVLLLFLVFVLLLNFTNLKESIFSVVYFQDTNLMNEEVSEALLYLIEVKLYESGIINFVCQGNIFYENLYSWPFLCLALKNTNISLYSVLQSFDYSSVKIGKNLQKFLFFSFYIEHSLPLKDYFYKMPRPFFNSYLKMVLNYDIRCQLSYNKIKYWEKFALDRYGQKPNNFDVDIHEVLYQKLVIEKYLLANDSSFLTSMERDFSKKWLKSLPLVTKSEFEKVIKELLKEKNTASSNIVK